MGLVYKSVKEVFEREGLKYPLLNMFLNRGTVIKCAYWQPLGEIRFDKNKGFFCISDHHDEKAQAFLEYIKADKIDIAITPEYSVPWHVLQEVINNKELWPKYGKLWCLGLEGISSDSLETFCNRNKQNDNLIIETEDLDEISLNSFFSCIAYLLYSEKKLVCILQFKTTAASDRWAELESKSLTPGNTIYYFSDEDENNCLLSYICADALNQGISTGKNLLHFQKSIILHPQLNPKPLHNSFNSMRRNFLDYTKTNTRIISVNWARDTKLRYEDEHLEINVEDSYTACYYNELATDNMQDLILRNKQKGIDILKDDHINIWHMPSKEHCMSFTIGGFDAKDVNNVATNHCEPLGNIYLEYCSGKWDVKEPCECCSIDWEWLESSFDFKKCCANDCEVNKLHRFFAVLFGKRIYSDIRLKEGFSTVAFNYKNRCVDEVIRLRERCAYVINELKTGNVPPKFSKIKEGKYKWVLSERGNLIDDGSENGTLMNIVYIDSADEMLIKKGIMEFQNLMGEAAKDKMLLYYFTGRGIKYYEKIYNTDISNPNLTEPIEKINEGR